MEDDLPVFEPVGDLPALGDAELERLLLHPVNSAVRNAEADCRGGYLSRASLSIRQLLQAGTPAQDLLVCLMGAVQSGNEDLVQTLLSAGVPISLEVVKIAIANKSIPLLSLFLGNGWNINEEEAWCIPALLSFAITTQADEPLISWFLCNGADPNTPCQMDITPLSSAVAEAPLFIVKRLFAHCPSATSYQGQLLHWAAARRMADDCDEILQLVIDRCEPDINATMYEDHAFSYEVRKVVGLGTALHEAARAGRTSAVKILLRNGADVSVRDSRGNTALEVAELEGNNAVAELLRYEKAKM